MRYSEIIDSGGHLVSILPDGSARVIESFGNVIDYNPDVNPRLFDLEFAASTGSISEAQIREFASFLNSHKNDFIRMYHGTSVAHDVSGNGLLPTSPGRAKSPQSAPGYVYVTYDPRRAVTFATMAYAGSYKDVIVYSVDVTIRRLLPDHDQLRNKRIWGNVGNIGNTLAHSMIYGAGARIKGRIEPFQITEFGRYDCHGHKIVS